MRGTHRSPVSLHPFSGGAVVVAVADPDDAGRLAFAFNEYGALTTLVFDQVQLLHALDRQPYDLVVVGSRLAGERPGRVLQAIRERTDAGVLALGGGETTGGRPDAAGADLVLAGGTPAPVVAARAMVLTGLRGDQRLEVTRAWGPLELDTARRRARWHGREVTVTPMQFRILYALVSADGAVVSKRDLHRLVWGSAVVDDGERIAAHVKRIRARLEDDPARPAFLLTVRGEGYRLADPEPYPRAVR